MRRFWMAALLCAGMVPPRALSAQSPVRGVNAVRLRLEKVDQVALDFGVDTTALRRDVIQRLAAGGISVTQETGRPELTIGVRVPKSLAPVDPGLLLISMRLVESETTGSHRELWNGSGLSTRFGTYGSLRLLVPQQVANGVDALIAAHRGT